MPGNKRLESVGFYASLIAAICTVPVCADILINHPDVHWNVKLAILGWGMLSWFNFVLRCIPR